MKIRFLGPIDRVTGSCYWLVNEKTGSQFLVDCGMRQGEAGADLWNSAPLPFDPKKISCVLLTHAHLDHCGLLPRLVREGFRGPVWCTRETANLARIVLADAARLTKMYTTRDVKRINFREPEFTSLFGILRPIDTDVFVAFFRTPHVLGAVSISVVWGPKPSPGEPNTQQSIVFSGDLGVNTEGHETLPLLRHAMSPYPSDYLVLESTYGGRRHPEECRSPGARLDTLAGAVDRCVLERRGVLVVPAFALGRVQDILFDLHMLFASAPDKYGQIPVMVHAPMAMKVSDVYRKEILRTGQTRRGVKLLNLSKGVFRSLGLSPENDQDVAAAILDDVLYRDEGPATGPNASIGMRLDPEGVRSLSPTVRSWRRIHEVVRERVDFPSGDGRGAILITGGGMCDGGPVLGYLPALLPLQSTTILLTGFQSAGTIGAKLLAIKDLPLEERAKLTDRIEFEDADSVRLADVKAEIACSRGYSGHLDQDGLVDWVFRSYDGKPSQVGRTIFLTHGNADQRRDLQRALANRAEAWKAAHGIAVGIDLPSNEPQWFDLDSGKWCPRELDPNGPDALRRENERLKTEIAHLKQRMSILHGPVGGFEMPRPTAPPTAPAPPA